MKKGLLIASLVASVLLLAGVTYFIIVPALTPASSNSSTNLIPNPGTNAVNPGSSGTTPTGTNSGTATPTSGGSSSSTTNTNSGGTTGTSPTTPTTPSTSSNSTLNPVNLGSAGTFIILAKTGISTTGTTSIIGNIGISPAAATFITGFGLIADASNQFSTSSLVTGNIYAANYAPPTPANMTTAISDMQTAYVDAAGRAIPTATELGAGNIDGMTLTPGLYKWGTGLNIPTGVTLDCQGNSSAVFIFQIAQTLTVGNGATINLANGCQASNIFWQVAGQTTLGTTSVFYGNILDQTAIVLNNGAALHGKALAQTAVTLIANSVTQ